MLFYNIIIFTVLITFTCSADSQDTLVYSKGIRKEGTDYILCRNCGNDVSSSEHITSKLSPVSHYSINDTLFNKDKVLIQLLSHDIFFYYPVITTTYSTCTPTEEWEDSPWFPDYRYRLCTCPECGVPIGWIFESTSLSVEQPMKFFGFILQTLVGESFIDSLLEYPETSIDYGND